MIAFVGSVFSPYYALARRRGAADPCHHLAINVALYGPRGAWAMTERGRSALSRDRDRFEVGPSRLAFGGDGLTLDLDEVAVPIPRRIRGRVRVHPEFLNGRSFVLDPSGRHLWRPIAPVARIEVEMDKPSLRWRGSAYIDHNRGSEPLEAGFSSWTWTRLSHAAGTDVGYATRPRGGPPEGFSVAFDRRGGLVVDEAPPAVPLPPTLWRVGREALSEDAAATRLVRTLEDTPFYARSQVAARLFGRTAEGLHESLDLDRFSSPVVQAMLPFRMPRRARWG